MTTAQQNRARAVATTAEIVEPLTLSPRGQEFVKPGVPPNQFLGQLTKHECFDDAIRFLAAWLPKRGAIWWGCLWLWHTSRPAPTGTRATALRSTIAWVLEPTEENRRATDAAGQAAECSTPEGALALSAFWSDGSMAPAGLPMVPPPPHLCAATVAEAILLSISAVPGADRGEIYCHCLQLGTDVASGKSHP